MQGRGRSHFLASLGAQGGGGLQPAAAAWMLSGAIGFGGNSFGGSVGRGCILTAKAPVLISFPGNTGFPGNREVQPPKFRQGDQAWPGMLPTIM